ncbi:DinB family protein [Flavivirga amylovorans]|uniref:DinB family protein n=1 Tax=Flavivirga amylovorans TaxID=870486 RepID=A0ABT8X2N0_9FLAO|nr:DinB family protein [Flavivirga amylovorans]MDO5988211.1 DinB family protein [Flavivirga amylovorans]
MFIEEIIQQLENNQQVFKSLLMYKKDKQYLWRPQPEKWNLLEIVCHLLDEERDDFKTRVAHALDTPEKPLVPIDPVGWVKEREYSAKNYNDILFAFLEERKQSVIWLRSKLDANWQSKLSHPELGDMSAKLFLTNWLAHDYLHIRQILRYDYNYLKEKINLDLGYAGNW